VDVSVYEIKDAGNLWRLESLAIVRAVAVESKDTPRFMNLRWRDQLFFFFQDDGIKIIPKNTNVQNSKNSNRNAIIDIFFSIIPSDPLQIKPLVAIF
jgi:hypothetical protein